jgi:raffinose/stachyose/melibiose transport system permease protein
MKTKKLRTTVTGLGGFLLGLLYVFPLGVLVINSFKPLRSIYINAFALPNRSDLTLINYPDAFKRLDYIMSFGNSLLITGCGTILCSLFSAMAAWVLVRYKTKTSTIIFLVTAASMLIPFQCVMLPLIHLMSSLNMLNRFGLVFMNVGIGSCFTIVIIHGFIKNIPKTLEEAAIIDGCNMVEQFFLIVFPLLRTIIITVSLLNAMFLWNDYLLPSLTINKNGWQTLPLKTYLFFGQFAKRWDLATAGLVMCMMPIVILFIFFQRYIINGITEGAIKT